MLEINEATITSIAAGACNHQGPVFLLRCLQRRYHIITAQKYWKEELTKSSTSYGCCIKLHNGCGNGAFSRYRFPSVGAYERFLVRLNSYMRWPTITGLVDFVLQSSRDPMYH